MQRLGKGILAVALAVLLAVTFSPAKALAAPTAWDVYSADDLATALTSAQSGDTIRLMASFTYGARIVIQAKSITFDLNGHTLNIDVSSGDALTVYNGGVVTLAGQGALNVQATASNSCGVVATGSGSSAQVTNVVAQGAANAAAICARLGGVVGVAGNVTVTSQDGYGVIAEQGGSAVTVGGSVSVAGTSCVGVYCNGLGSAVQIAGDVAVAGSDSNGVYADSGMVTVGGGVSVPVSGTSTGVQCNQNAVVTVDGSILASADRYISVDTGSMAKGDGAEGAGDDVGYLVYTRNVSNAKVRVKIKVCQIGATEYSTLDAALAHVSNGQTIRLLRDINHTSPVVVDGKAITFDLNGYTLNVDVSSGDALTVQGGGVVTLIGQGELNVKATAGFGRGVYATGSGSRAQVTNASAQGEQVWGAYATGGSVIDVAGDITVTTQSGWGAMAASGGTVTVGGSVSVAGASCGGVSAYSSGCTIQVAGDVTAAGNNNIGAYAEGGTVTVGGSVSVPANGLATGVICNEDASITVEGSISASEDRYIIMDFEILMKADGADGASADAGYRVYTRNVSDAKVRVKIKVCGIGATEYITLDAALAQVADGQTIRLLRDIDHSSPVVVAGKAITFDLNGHTLNIEVSSGNALTVQGGGVVALAGHGELNVKNTAEYGFAVYATGSGSSAQVTNATLTTATGPNAGAVGAFATEGGAIDVAGDIAVTGPACMGVSAFDGSTVSVGGGVSVTGDGCIGVYTSGTGTMVTVSASVVWHGNNGYGIKADNGGSATVGGSICANGVGGVGVYSSRSTVQVAGNVSMPDDGTGLLLLGDATVTVDGTIRASADRYIGVEDVYLAKGEGVAGAGDDAGYLVYTRYVSSAKARVKIKVCQIGTTEYVTLGDALAQVADGQTLRLLEDIDHSSSIVVDGKEIVFDLNGHTLNIGVSAGNALTVQNGGVVTLDGQGQLNAKTTASHGIAVYATGSGSSAQVTNATAQGDACVGVYADGAGSAVLVTGNVAATGNNSVGASAVGGTVTINGTLAGVKYIRFGSVYKLATEMEAATTKDGYATYTDGAGTVWVKASFDVTFNSDGTAFATRTAPAGIAVGADWPANPTKPGYDFGGWFAGAGGTGAEFTADTLVQAPVTVYAKWTPIDYSITYDLADGTVEPANPAGYTIESSAIMLNNPTKTGYTFAGWSGTGIEGTAMSVTIPTGSTGSRTYTAHWEIIDYGITYDLAHGALNPVNPNPAVYNVESEPITLNNPTRAGYTFAGWSGTGIVGTSTNVVIPTGSTGDRTYTANWTANTYTVTFNAQGGTVGPATKTVTFGATYGTLPTPAKTGHTFGGWYTGTGGTGTKVYSSSAVTITANQTLYARWTANTYTVIFNAQGGTVSPATKTVTFGATYGTLPTPARTGHTFSGWYTGTGGTGTKIIASSTVSLAANRTLYAKWTANKYTITSTANNTAWGTVSGGGSFAYGTQVTAEATPRAGYRFVRWLEGTTAVSTSASYSFSVTKARTLKAEFAKIGTPVVKAASVGYNSIRLTWPAVAGVNGYEISRYDAATKQFKVLTTVTGTSYTGTGLITGKTYSYKVRAKCKAGSVTTYGGYSAVVSVKAVPATPTAVKAVRASATSIKLTWGAVAGASGYEVYRSVWATGTYAKVADAASATFTDTKRTTGKTYYYKVRAYRLVSGVRVYSGYSAMVYAKP